MQLSSQKLVAFALPLWLSILDLLPSVSSSNERTTMENINSSNKYKITPQLLFEIKLHGFLLWASVGFLMPVSILIKRMSNREESGTRLRIIFYAHAITQVITVLLATAGAVMSIKYFDNSFNNDHQRIGLAFYVFMWLQAFLGIFRPHRYMQILKILQTIKLNFFRRQLLGGIYINSLTLTSGFFVCRRSKGRSIWFLFHWLVGIALSLLGVINIYTGLQAYNKRTSKNVGIWTMLFTVQISVIFLIYLLQEKWHYLKKQGDILGSKHVQPTDQEMSPRCQQKEASSEPC